MSEILVNLTELEKSFKARGHRADVLKGINLEISRGEFVAIEGRSGSGKSTLLSIIGLLDYPSKGEYVLCDHAVSELNSYQKSTLRNQNIGWIFQNFNLINDMTIKENVCLPLKYHKKIDKKEFDDRVENVLKQVGLFDKIDELPENLSGGQQQRVAIARAMVTEPDLILADEPTGNLDSESASIVFELLKTAHQSGKTVILVTHDSEMAEACDKRHYLLDGKIIDNYYGNGLRAG